MNDKLKSKLKELKALLFSEEAPAATEEKPAEFKDVKSKDGKAFKVSALEVGASIEVVDEAGVSAPAPDGDVELEDGSVITVKEGKIEAIKPAEEKPSEEKPTDTAPQFKAEDFVSKVDFDALQKSFNELAGKFEAISKSNEANVKALVTAYEAIEAFSNESEEKPTDAPKIIAFSSVKTEKEIKQKALKDAITAATKK